MTPRRVRHLAAVALAPLFALSVWATDARAASAVNISTCQTLSTPNTVYKLTADLTSCGDCLIVSTDRITVDLQGHTITSTCPGTGAAITDQGASHDLTTVRAGKVDSFGVGVDLLAGTRSSVIDVTATNNNFGIVVGDHSLVKSCKVQNSVVVGVSALGERNQIQQCEVSGSGQLGIHAGDKCLVTLNISNDNTRAVLGGTGIGTGEKCTVSLNTANKNKRQGISVGSGSLVTHNTATDNLPNEDFFVLCPSDVTHNTSTAGFPASYVLDTPPPCHTVGND